MDTTEYGILADTIARFIDQTENKLNRLEKKIDKLAEEQAQQYKQVAKIDTWLKKNLAPVIDYISERVQAIGKAGGDDAAETIRKSAAYLYAKANSLRNGK